VVQPGATVVERLGRSVVRLAQPDDEEARRVEQQDPRRTGLVRAVAPQLLQAEDPLVPLGVDRPRLPGIA
jgi:hypothetical protein